jgi:tripartite-type tricarboxylate transporter receptor subunit TctC
MKGILRRTLLGAALTAATLSGMAAPALAEYPDRPVKFIYGFPPGDIDELLMRMIADKMTEMTGVPAAVIDKPGGAASVAAVSVLEQPADGATVGGFALSVPIVHPLRGHEVLKKDSFEPVAIFLSYPMILVTKSDNSFNNLAELKTYSGTTPISFGHFGDGALPTLVTMQTFKDMGVQMKGAAAFDEVNCGTVLNGDADVALTNIQTVLPCLTSGEVKAIASMTEQRLPMTPDAATYAEQTGSDPLYLWFGLFVKAGTPQEVKDKLIEVTTATLETEQAKALAAQGNAGLFMKTGADAVAFVDGYYQRVEKILAAAQ